MKNGLLLHWFIARVTIIESNLIVVYRCSKLFYNMIFNNHNDAHSYLAVALLSLTTMSCRDKPLYSAVFTNF